MGNKIRLGAVIIVAPGILIPVAVLVGGERYVGPLVGGVVVLAAIGALLLVLGVRELSTGPRRLLATGTSAVAIVDEVNPTGTVINNVNLVLEVVLTVRPEGAAPYRATTRTMLPIHQAGLLAPGQPVAVRVDPARPSRVAIDPDPPADWVERASRPTPSPLTTEEIIATGAPAVAQIVNLRLTGKTIGQLGGNPQHPERNAHPAVILELLVQPQAAPGFPVTAVYAVPPDRLAGLAQGGMLPARFVHHAGAPLVAIDWERVRPSAGS